RAGSLSDRVLSLHLLRGLSLCFYPHADHFRYALFFHGYSIKRFCHFHGPLAVSDYQELGIPFHFYYLFGHSSDINLIQGGVNLIHYAEWTRFVSEHGKHHRQPYQGLLTAR